MSQPALCAAPSRDRPDLGPPNLRAPWSPAAPAPAGGRIAGRRGCVLRLLDGWAARVRRLADGEHQVLSFLLPGDIWRPHRFGADGATDALALTDAVTSELPEAALEAPEGAGLAALLADAEAREDRALFDQLLRLGRLSARERTMHLLWELHGRLLGCGLADGGAMPMPLTQKALAEILGLSAVHLNRTLAALKDAGLLRVTPGRLELRRIEAWRAWRESLEAGAAPSPGGAWN